MSTSLAIEHWLKDPEVMEIMIDGHERVMIEKRGKLESVPSPYTDEAHLLRDIATMLPNRVLDESHPIIDALLPDRSLVCVVGRPISLMGPAVTIRKFHTREMTVEDLIGFGSWTHEIVTFLRACVAAKLNVVIAGGTSSGKMTVANIVCGMIPPDDRVVLTERIPEMNFQHPRLVTLLARPANLEGKGEITFSQIVETAMKMRPDRIIASDLQGGEAYMLLQAFNTGHDGGIATLHASGVADVLVRLEMMIAQGNPTMPLMGIREQIASGIQIIAYQERMPDGKRRLTKIAEVVGLESANVKVQDIFEFRQTGMEDGTVQGYFTGTGVIPRCLTRIRNARIDLPVDIFLPRS